MGEDPQLWSWPPVQGVPGAVPTVDRAQGFTPLFAVTQRVTVCQAQGGRNIAPRAEMRPNPPPPCPRARPPAADRARHGIGMGWGGEYVQHRIGPHGCPTAENDVRENLIGPFVAHKRSGPRRPLPLPPSAGFNAPTAGGVSGGPGPQVQCGAARGVPRRPSTVVNIVVSRNGLEGGGGSRGPPV